MKSYRPPSVVTNVMTLVSRGGRGYRPHPPQPARAVVTVRIVVTFTGTADATDGRYSVATLAQAKSLPPEWHLLTPAHD